MNRLVSIILMFFAAPALAEQNYIEFQYYTKQESELSSAALEGYMYGVHWANTLLWDSTGLRLYCQPEHLTVNIENLKGGMKLHVENNPELETAPLGEVVVAGLQLLFPCD